MNNFVKVDIEWVFFIKGVNLNYRKTEYIFERSIILTQAVVFIEQV